MAMQSSYKNRRSSRTASIDTDFSKGMMFTNNNVDDGYVKTMVNFDFENDNRVLTPRAGLRTKDIILPDFSHTFSSNDPFYDEDLSIQAAKECIENDIGYRQLILGVPNSTAPYYEGRIWFLTTSEDFSTRSADETLDININRCRMAANSIRCTFFDTDLPQIHDIKLTKNRKFTKSIGTFGFLNSFYFFGIETDQQTQTDKTYLYHTVFDNSNSDNKKWHYKAEKVNYKELTASEAVNYGYNMLLGEDAYTFSDGLGGSLTFQMEGILPYDRKFASGVTPKLLMSPKHDTKIWFRCNYDVPADARYKIIWSWKELSADDWTSFSTDENFTVASGTTDLPVIQAELIPPSAEIMVRCEAYKYDSSTSTFEDAVEKAMTVGFDFTIDENQSNTNMQPEIYDITTGKGMTYYKNRLVVYGLPKDPTILFLSDYNEPSYFPYPNNIVTFDEPIVHAISFMDKLIVFTTNKIYSVTLNEDGNSWTTEVIQANLYIEPYDKHLVKAVRNMLYFKSGNYYYMMVPKAYSTTGELTLAPITTPITSFFDNFSANVSNILKDTYGRSDIYTLVSFYDFLDYEFIHNMYVFSWQDEEDVDSYIHFDIMYNTNNRYWKICVYESPGSLYPYKNNATQYGLLASTSVNQFNNPASSTGETVDGRIIQILRFDSSHPKDFFFPSDVEMTYYPNFTAPTITATSSGNILRIPALAEVESGVLSIDEAAVDLPIKGNVLTLASSYSYDSGFKISDFDQFFNTIISNYSTYFTYRNYQFLDTGYTAQDYVVNKRYRELQLQLCNHNNEDLMFRFDFLVAGEPRQVIYKYEVNQLIDELDPNYGIVDVDSIPITEVDYDSYYSINADDVDLSNDLVIKEGLFPSVDYWKIRANVSGKGVSPRFRLNSRNEILFQILSLSWVYRIMNMR